MKSAKLAPYNANIKFTDKKGWPDPDLDNVAAKR